MDFLAWHYGPGLSGCYRSFSYLVLSVFHNFSFIILFKSLFSPWKRLLAKDKSNGFNLQRFFENLSFNLISRGVGFCVRVILIVVGLLLLVVSFLIAFLGVILWIIFPPVGFMSYLAFTQRHSLYLNNLIKKAGLLPDWLSVLFNNEAGLFVAQHIGQTLPDFIAHARKVPLIDLTGIKSYAKLIEKLLEAGVFTTDSLHAMKVLPKDLVFAAGWWDKIKIEKTEIKPKYYRRPGLGLELLYGYTPFLNQYTIDLSMPQAFSHHLIGREEIVVQMERSLNAGNSVILTGNSGVGKKTICMEFARRAYLGQLGPKMAFRRILEFDYNSLLAASSDLNEKKVNLTSALEEASYAGNIILVIRDIHRITNPQVEGYDFTDIFEKMLEKKELKIIAILESTDYERFIAPNMRLRNFMERIEAKVPSDNDALQIIRDSAEVWEENGKIIVLVQAIRSILEGSEKYITDAPFPEKALDILDAVVEYLNKNGGRIMTEDEVNAVLSEKTGISLARLTQKEKSLLSNLESIIHEKLIDQTDAVSMIAKSLRSRTIGVSKEDRPIGSFLFLGPTGVGKTETAKVLANVYYGSRDAMIRFDMSAYSGEDAAERLIGSVKNGRPGDLSTAIKNRPASLLLLDEIEKGGRVIHNLLLTMLDEGYLIDAFGKKINCRHLFIIGTSNAAAEFIRESVNENISGEKLQKDVIEYCLRKDLFFPEFINRFDGTIVFKPLKMEHLLQISRLMFTDLINNLTGKNIHLQVEDSAIRKLAEDGFDPAFGARPMRRVIDLTIGDLLGKAILNGDIVAGDRIKLITSGNAKEFLWTKIPQ